MNALTHAELALMSGDVRTSHKLKPIADTKPTVETALAMIGHALNGMNDPRPASKYTYAGDDAPKLNWPELYSK